MTGRLRVYVSYRVSLIKHTECICPEWSSLIRTGLPRAKCHHRTPSWVRSIIDWSTEFQTSAHTNIFNLSDEFVDQQSFEAVSAVLGIVDTYAEEKLKPNS